MTIELDREEAAFLVQALARHISEIQDELAHTESFALQRELHRDIDRLEQILTKVRDGAAARPSDRGAAQPS